MHFWDERRADTRQTGAAQNAGSDELLHARLVERRLALQTRLVGVAPVSGIVALRRFVQVVLQRVP
jgi:hypothetical protein